MWSLYIYNIAFLFILFRKTQIRFTWRSGMVLLMTIFINNNALLENINVNICYKNIFNNAITRKNCVWKIKYDFVNFTLTPNVTKMWKHCYTNLNPAVHIVTTWHVICTVTLLQRLYASFREKIHFFSLWCFCEEWLKLCLWQLNELLAFCCV